MIRGGVTGSAVSFPYEPIRVELSLVSVVSVEDVAPEGRELLPVDHLGRARSRFRVLPCHAANSHDSLVGSPDESQAHLEEQLDLGLNRILLAVVEQLCAVSALQEECLALCYVAQELLQLEDLLGQDERRQAFQFL